MHLMDRCLPCFFCLLSAIWTLRKRVPAFSLLVSQVSASTPEGSWNKYRRERREDVMCKNNNSAWTVENVLLCHSCLLYLISKYPMSQYLQNSDSTKKFEHITLKIISFFLKVYRHTHSFFKLPLATNQLCPLLSSSDFFCVVQFTVFNEKLKVGTLPFYTW